MYKLKRFWKLAVFAVCAALLLIILPLLISSGANSIPPEFNEARERGAKISKDIVSHYSQSAVMLREISELDSKGEYLEGLKIVLDQIEVNAEARSKAQSLATELEKMTRAASLISSQSLRAKALEAVSIEINLVTQLVAYNEYTNQLLDALRSKFISEPERTAVEDIISQMNSAASEINLLNEKFNAIMKEFDAKL